MLSYVECMHGSEPTDTLQVDDLQFPNSASESQLTASESGCYCLNQAFSFNTL